jgi:hypothetical protein
MMKLPSNDPNRVTEEVARELLARAAALDIGGPQLAHLREAAIEAGISGAAFDQAVREWKVQAAKVQSMDLLAGGPAIQGRYAHIGLMVAGIGGVAASQLWRSRGDRGASSTSGSESEQSSEPANSGADDGKSGGVGLTNAEADKRFIELLRLRRELLLESFAAQVAR